MRTKVQSPAPQTKEKLLMNRLAKLDSLSKARVDKDMEKQEI
jgi:hypothetical protein